MCLSLLNKLISHNMKKLILTLVFSVLFLSCKSKSVTNNQVDNKTERVIKGNWQITAVNYPGSDVIKVTSFDLADSKCFIGSNWKFVSNNNKGNVEINKAGCEAFSSPIVWSITKEGTFTLKIVEAGTKAKKVTEGFNLKYVAQSETSFQLVDKINVGGKITDVVYQFEKVN